MYKNSRDGIFVLLNNNSVVGYVKGKRIKSCISEAITDDGIRILSIMGMIPYDIDDNGLGIYYSPDCLEKYIKQMKECTIHHKRNDFER